MPASSHKENDFQHINTLSIYLKNEKMKFEISTMIPKTLQIEKKVKKTK